MSFSATRRRTDSVCSANHTWPIPPVPSTLTRRYGPTRLSSRCSLTTVVAQMSCDRAAASPCTASSESTSLRKSVSCAHAASRNAARWSGACSKAWPTISLTFGQFSGVTVASLHLTHQPHLCYVPLPLHCRSGNPQDFGDLFGSQSAKETQFNNASLLFIQFCKSGQRVVQRDEVSCAQLPPE